MIRGNKALLILTISFLSMKSSGQELLEIAIGNDVQIIQKEPYAIEQYLAEEYLMFYHKKALKQIEGKGIDLNTVRELFLREIEIKNSWNESDFPQALLLEKNEKIELSELDKILEKYGEDERASIIDDVNSYNNDLQNWRKLPIAISRPIYSKEKNLAIIGYNYGNEIGKISLFHKEQNDWKFVVEISNWIY